MIFNRGIDTLKITALANHKPEILNNYIRIYVWLFEQSFQQDWGYLELDITW
jgi:hypothetical protein